MMLLTLSLLLLSLTLFGSVLTITAIPNGFNPRPSAYLSLPRAFSFQW